MSAEMYHQALEAVGAIEQKHTVLHSGLHTDIKVIADRLIDHPDQLDVVMQGVYQRIQEARSQLVVPVPKGATDIATKGWLPYRINVIRTEKQVIDPQTNEQAFVIPKSSELLVRMFSRITIFEDVVTTGDSLARMADKVVDVNPGARLSLVAIWSRDELKPEHANRFVSQSYLIEDKLPAWPADDCETCSAR